MLKASQRLQRTHCASSFSKTRNRIGAQPTGMLKPLVTNSWMLASTGRSRLFPVPDVWSTQLHCALFAVQVQLWERCGLVMWRGRPRPRESALECLIYLAEDGSGLVAVFTSTCRRLAGSMPSG